MKSIADNPKLYTKVSNNKLLKPWFKNKPKLQFTYKLLTKPKVYLFSRCFSANLTLGKLELTAAFAASPLA